MATWHQNQNPVPLYHETDWTIVSDPPGDMRCLIRFSTKEAAEERLDTWKKNGSGQHCYILAPYSGPNKVLDNMIRRRK